MIETIETVFFIATTLLAASKAAELEFSLRDVLIVK